ncbi:hypothetical protein PACTADRAFT_51850 [Pachysolen tannophilus NRRL Y-2460]|uniref:Uncharacterized protein n=1 Tax=Pachysolen tannophilus NRRL Y-2460 TaxID=669874 RepID=A0A1E4TND1_PACTA|nr:hypothetical protein PACTADRAFT_51850 [Pachysolen tannophilus NRRL Y-2460]
MDYDGYTVLKQVRSISDLPSALEINSKTFHLKLAFYLLTIYKDPYKTHIPPQLLVTDFTENKEIRSSLIPIDCDFGDVEKSQVLSQGNFFFNISLEYMQLAEFLNEVAKIIGRRPNPSHLTDCMLTKLPGYSIFYRKLHDVVKASEPKVTRLPKDENTLEPKIPEEAAAAAAAAAAPPVNKKRKVNPAFLFNGSRTHGNNNVDTQQLLNDQLSGSTQLFNDFEQDILFEENEEDVDFITTTISLKDLIRTSSSKTNNNKILEVKGYLINYDHSYGKNNYIFVENLSLKKINSNNSIVINTSSQQPHISLKANKLLERPITLKIKKEFKQIGNLWKAFYHLIEIV